MDGTRFDTLVRTLTHTRSRRGTLALALASLITLGAQPAVAKKSKKPKPNAFGCLNAGQKCRGTASK